MRSWRTRFTGAGLALVAFLTLTAEDLTVTQSEIDCEQAVAHLANCCPGFPTSQFHCIQKACEATPDFTVSESQCIVQQDCDAIRAAGWCAISTDDLVPRTDGGSVIRPVCQ